ncbi:hypothetical protein DKW60_22625 [Leucothrix pacifica]|uniref:Uncharacterized protein n=1 Tax=Leucothrix pacifica TaxID=1247513 RepID=A0A317C1U6_9GAMM|nr:hypothetical protein DKW60_22625 [Leucothrix pacifica]
MKLNTVLKLGLEILNGGRSGTKFTLPDKQTSEQKSLPFITENESIKFKLEVNPEVLSAAILLYDIRIDFTNVVIDNEKQIKSFYWEPKSGYFGNGYEALFKNYFGVAELQIELEDSETSKLVELHPLEVLASKLSAERVEKMLEFLSAHNSQEIYSAFHATKRRASLAEGDQEPDMALEKLELITQFLEERVPQICHSPITRLTPKRTITDYHENLYPDESSIAWLSENLSYD